MRVFAGPNGSGKSTIINEIRKIKFNDKPVDFGVYINADDIAFKLRHGKLNFRDYDIETTPDEFLDIALKSGLVAIENNQKNTQGYAKDEFLRSYTIKGNLFRLSETGDIDKVSQILADFLRQKLLAQKRKFSFETVFSHESKLDIMRAAKAQGYKVYLYFVSTNDPKVNEYRVNLRVRQGGHDVPADKIESRYYRSLDLLYEAAQIAYQCYFFDNSRESPESPTGDGADSHCFARFKVIDGKKQWTINEDKVPPWFLTYYSQKIPKS